jgi:hypothetical protein
MAFTSIGIDDNSNALAMTIDSSERVGIGTAAPAAQLDVQGPAGTGTASAGVLRLSTAELTVVDNDQVGRIDFIAPLESSGTDSILVGASIYGEAEATFAVDDNSTALVFATGTTAAATERMRINRHGNVGIGNAGTFDNPNSAGKVLEIAYSGNVGLILNDTRDANPFTIENRGAVLHICHGTTTRFKMLDEGKIFTLPTYNNTSSGGANVYILSTGELHRSTSSIRYKTNIVDSAKGLTELLTLRPVDFNSLCSTDDPNKLRTGLIAEEVDELGFDEYVVRDEENEVQSVEYGHMVALSVKAIQELSAKNDALETQVATMWAVEQDSSSNNAALEARIIALEAA